MGNRKCSNTLGGCAALTGLPRPAGCCHKPALAAVAELHPPLRLLPKSAPEPAGGAGPTVGPGSAGHGWLAISLLLLAISLLGPLLLLLLVAGGVGPAGHGRLAIFLLLLLLLLTAI